MRLCMGSRRGFICRMKIGNSGGMMSSISGHNLHQRLKQRNTLGPTRDGNEFAVIHCTGYIKNWPPSGQFDHPLSGMMSICRLITSMTLTNNSQKSLHLELSKLNFYIKCHVFRCSN